MTKLNQIVAVLRGAKEDTNKATAPLFHALKRGELFTGITQTYRPAEEGGVTLPDDNTRVQATVPDMLERFEKPMTRLFDLICTTETANMSASADVVVDGQVLIPNAPVTFLMQFEKYLEREVRGYVALLPTLDPAETWNPLDGDLHETPPFETFRTRKVQKPIVLYPHSDRHPAQTQMITEDVIDGYWTKKKFSGAIPPAHKQVLIERVEVLIEAVKHAREKANDVDVADVRIGQSVFGYLFDSP